MGLHATAVDDPEQLGRAWDAALTAEQPTLLDVRTDLEVPPIPPHVTYDQMKSTAEAISRAICSPRSPRTMRPNYFRTSPDIAVCLP
jgi:hypothetical protein